MRKGRVAFLVGVAVFGLVIHGATGMFVCLLAFGFAAFMYYTVMDGMHSVFNFMSQPKEMVVRHVYEDGLPGHPDIEGKATRVNPDPTRPDAEDFSGLITYRIGKGN